MIKYLFLTLILLINVIFLKSQSDCATIGPTQDFLQSIPTANKALALNNATVKIFIHIIRASNGNNALSASIIDAFNSFNQAPAKFAPLNICLTLTGIGFINNSQFYNSFDLNNPSVSGILWSGSSFKTDAINVYIVPDHNYSLNGIASDISGSAFIITTQSFLNNETFAHELGHCLGLYHTFQSTSSNLPWACPENINGSNCDICGDLVCDTPADNNGSTDGNCNYTGGGGYNPFTNNIMSYYDGCLTQFTNGQGLRMRDVIANSQTLLDRLVPDNITITSTTYPLIIGPPSCNSSSPPPNCPAPLYNLLEIGKSKISTSGNVIVNPDVPNNNPNNLIATIGFI